MNFFMGLNAVFLFVMNRMFCWQMFQNGKKANIMSYNHVYHVHYEARGLRMRNKIAVIVWMLSDSIEHDSNSVAHTIYKFVDTCAER